MEDLIFRSLQRETSDLEERQLRRWRAASPENEAAYQRVARLCQLPVNAMGRPPGPVPRPPRPELAAITGAADARRIAARRDAFWRSRRAWLLTGAAAAGLLAAAWGTWRLLGSTRGIAFGAAAFTTGRQETVTARLTDGSYVRLGPSSRLRFSEAGPSREAWLEGRGFFAVAKDPAHPFLIHTDAGVARVIGTRFEIQVREHKLRLAVVEGSVALSAGGAEVRVEAGEVSHVEGSSPPSVLKVNDVYALLDWPSGVLVFQATPLRQVASEFERHYRVRVEITDSTLARRAVTAWFSDQSLTEALTTVCRVVRARCAIRDSLATVAPLQ